MWRFKPNLFSILSNACTAKGDEERGGPKWDAEPRLNRRNCSSKWRNNVGLKPRKIFVSELWCSFSSVDRSLKSLASMEVETEVSDSLVVNMISLPTLRWRTSVFLVDGSLFFASFNFFFRTASSCLSLRYFAYSFLAASRKESSDEPSVLVGGSSSATEQRRVDRR